MKTYGGERERVSEGEKEECKLEVVRRKKAEKNDTMQIECAAA